MITEQQANATLAHFQEALMMDQNVQSVSVMTRPALEGGQEWIIEIGVLDPGASAIASSLPVPLPDGTLSSLRVPVVVVPSDRIEAY